MVKELATLAEFNSVLEESKDKLVVVDFTATWCGPCQMIGPKVEALSRETAGVTFVKVDVDKNKDTSEKCGISAMPTFHFYKNKVLVHKFSGANEDELKEAVNRHK